MIIQYILDQFNVMVVENKRIQKKYSFAKCEDGYITNFVPTGVEQSLLRAQYQPIEISTLFSRAERENSSPAELIAKQILHYIEIYGLDEPGLFNLEVKEGKFVAITNVRGVTKTQLGQMVRDLLYTNAPVKDAVALSEVIAGYDIDFDVNEIQNNEMRILLFDETRHVFNSGDDAVRYVVYKATESPLLIKSREVIDAVKEVSVGIGFLTAHENVLASVFNRHKKIVMSLKNDNTKSIINRISKKSKKMHVPIRMHVSKTFIADALRDEKYDIEKVLEKVTIRDKFKYLNLLEWKKMRSKVDAFIIRNGKIHIAEDRKTYLMRDIRRVEDGVLASLKKDLSGLVNKSIVLDKRVDYGLPISRKQTVGRLPFGTKVLTDGGISSGIYWHNDGGAKDLDLSTVNRQGVRIGWGTYSAYNKKHDITFSGDITDARVGANEFMTSKKSDYGLFVNIYSGKVGCEYELLVGNGTKEKTWLHDTIIREKSTLNSNSSIVGFVSGNEFTVWAGRLSNKIISESNPVIERNTANPWTVKRLFSELDIPFIEFDKRINVNKYDHDMTYASFSYDKLENLLLK